MGWAVWQAGVRALKLFAGGGRGWQVGMGWQWGGCLMFHLLFVPRYLDYAPTDLGGYLGLSPGCLEGLFHFMSVYFTHTFSLKHTFVPFFACHTSTLLSHPITIPNPFFFSFSSSIHPYSSLLLSCSLPSLCFPLFCADIKQLTTCHVAGLQRAGRGVLLSLCIYRYFVIPKAL